MNQEKRQQSVRAVTGTAYHYEGDWHALFDLAGVASGTFNDRLRAWINTQLGTSYQFLPDAMQAYAVSQGFTSWNEMGTFSPYDVDALAWFAAMPTQPNATVKSILNTFVSGLKTDSLWSLIDGGNFLCLETLAQGLVDFKNPARVATTAPGFTSTFISYRGVTGSGSAAGSQDAYIDTGFIPSSAGGVYTLNSMHLGIFVGNNVVSSTYDIGVLQNPNYACLCARSGSNNIPAYFNNSSFENTATAASITTSVGHTVTTKTGAATNKSYRNGVDTGGTASAAAVALPSNSIRYLQLLGTVAVTRQIQMAHYGAGLNATQPANLNTHVQAAIAALTVL